MSVNRLRVRSSLRATAFHEAGHALACYKGHLRFKRITIEPDDESLGHVLTDPLRLSDQHVYNMSPVVRDRLERRIVSLLAGREAERLVTGRYNNRGAQSDYQVASDFTLRVIGTPDEAGWYFRWLKRRTWLLVNAARHRPLLDTLADALMKRRTLTEAEAIEEFEIASGMPAESRTASLRASFARTARPTEK